MQDGEACKETGMGNTILGGCPVHDGEGVRVCQTRETVQDGQRWAEVTDLLEVTTHRVRMAL
jgi:hypothetical protein